MNPNKSVKNIMRRTALELLSLASDKNSATDLSKVALSELVWELIDGSRLRHDDLAEGLEALAVLVREEGRNVSRAA